MILDPIRCVADFTFYKEMPKKTVASTVGYLAFVGLIFSAALTLAVHLQVVPRIESAARWAAESVPPLTLEGGKLSSGIEGPVLVRHPQVPEVAFIIDTDRVQPVTAAEMSGQKVVAYLAQDAIYVLSRQRLETYDISKAQNPKPLSIDAEFYRRVGKVIVQVLYPLSFFCGWLAFMVWKHIASLLYSLLGLAINAVGGYRLDYATVYKTVVYAQTPVIVLQLILLFLPRPIPFFPLLSILVTGVYSWQGLRQQVAAPSAEQPAE